MSAYVMRVSMKREGTTELVRERKIGASTIADIQLK